MQGKRMDNKRNKIKEEEKIRKTLEEVEDVRIQKAIKIQWKRMKQKRGEIEEERGIRKQLKKQR